MKLRQPGLMLAITLLAACSSGPFARRAATPVDEVASLKARVLELQRQVTVHEVELARLRERLVRLEGARAAMPAPAHQATPTPSPPGGLEDGVRPDRASSFEQADLPSPTPRSPLPEEPLGREVEPGPEVPATAAAQSRYDQAYQLYQAGRYPEAEAAFRSFLATWGNTDLADNAGYWIGESRWARQDFEGALTAFRQAIERQPSGNKVPDSLFKMGRCLERLGDNAGAREVFTEVVERFSASAVAASAKERIAALP